MNADINKSQYTIISCNWAFSVLLLLFIPFQIGVGQVALVDGMHDNIHRSEPNNIDLRQALVSVDMDEVPLDQAIRHLGRKAGVTFNYNSKILPSSKLISYRSGPVSLDAVLKDILPYGIEYITVRNIVILQEKDVIEDISSILQETITGIVTDVETGEAIPGVNVVILGSTTGVATDSSGEFELSVNSLQGTLMVSFIGYRSLEVPINGRSNIPIELEQEVFGLDEVIAIGYGTVEKSDLTGSVGSISSEDIGAIHTTNVMESLKGRTAGVQVIQNSGEPGGSISIRIRGTNSIQGNNEPLYVVDGFPLTGSNPTVFNNLDIESIEVLKDASATSIYGSRGANGVIVITTKSGTPGQTNVDIESSIGIQSIRSKIDMMNAKEYAEFYNIVGMNDGWGNAFTQEEINNFSTGFDWQDYIFRDAPIQNHHINVSSGTESTRFTISGGLLDERGIIENSGYSRYSLLSNISHNISDDARIGTNLNLVKNTKDNQSSSGGGRGTSLFSGALYSFPTITPYNEDGTIRDLRQVYHWSPEIRNPMLFINETKSKNTANIVLANAHFEYDISSSLSLRVMGGIQNDNSSHDFYRTNNYHGAAAQATKSSSESINVLNENTVSYEQNFGRHSISSVFGFTTQRFSYSSLNASGTGFQTDIQESYDLGASSNPGVPGSSYSENTILSGLGRINYNFDDRYLLTVAYRADGSSIFSEGSKWGYFPSGALAWRISNETFMNQSQVISDLKLRMSWGITGSQAIGAYATLNRLFSGQTVFGGNYHPTYAPGTTLPGSLKWETTQQTNIGLDISVLDDRFSITADYYYKNTTDLLNPVPMSPSVGFRQTIDNVGVITNRGLDIGLNANIISSSRLMWSVDANISFNRNNVKELYDNQDILGSRYNVTLANDYINILKEGQPLGIFYGYVQDGYDDDGFLKYADLNDDGVINSDDKTIIGDPNPNFIYGFNSTLSYSNFELGIFLQGVQGADIFNLSGLNNTLDVDFGGNMPREVYYDRWTVDNQDAKYPNPSFQNQVLFSTRQVEDGSYLRFRNIQLAYNLPVNMLGLSNISNMQIYFSGVNLITFTKYSRWDPEVNSYGGSSSINIGIDHHSYPVNKSVNFGIKLSI